MGCQVFVFFFFFLFSQRQRATPFINSKNKTNTKGANLCLMDFYYGLDGMLYIHIYIYLFLEIICILLEFVSFYVHHESMSSFHPFQLASIDSFPNTFSLPSPLTSHSSFTLP